MKIQDSSPLIYVTATALTLIFGSHSVALSQSCEQLCISDPLYMMMNQTVCLKARLTGSCSGAQPKRPPGGGPSSISRQRPDVRNYQSLGLPGDFGQRPPSERRRIASGVAAGLMDKQKYLLNQMDSIANTPAQNNAQAKMLRDNFNNAQIEYDKNNKKLQELRRAYEGDIPRN